VIRCPFNPVEGMEHCHKYVVKRQEGLGRPLVRRKVYGDPEVYN
jgi:hypothetical protein